MPESPSHRHEAMWLRPASMATEGIKFLVSDSCAECKSRMLPAKHVVPDGVPGRRQPDDTTTALMDSETTDTTRPDAEYASSKPRSGLIHSWKSSVFLPAFSDPLPSAGRCPLQWHSLIGHLVHGIVDAVVLS